MSTITKEWLQHKITAMEAVRDEIPFGLDEDDSNTIAAMRIALASLEAEVVAWIVHARTGDQLTTDGSYVANAEGILGLHSTPLYTSQPASVVPEEIDLTSAPEVFEIAAAAERLGLHGTYASYAVGWNACRATMLQGPEPVTTAYKLPEERGSSLQLRNLIRQRHAEWSDKTFGNVGPVGPLKHLSKEALEAAAEPDDLSEWADIQFLLWDAQRRAGICDGEITAAMEEKLRVNMARKWPEPKDGEPRLHIKAAPQQEVK